MPGIEGDYRDALTEGVADLRERPVGPAHGYHGAAALDHDDVPCVGHASADRDVHPGIGIGGVAARQHPDRRSAGGLGSAAGRLHDAAQAAAHQGYAALAQLRAHLLGKLGYLIRRPACPDHGNYH